MLTMKLAGSIWVTKVLEGLPKILRVSHEGLALLNTNLLRVWIEGLV